MPYCTACSGYCIASPGSLWREEWLGLPGNSRSKLYQIGKKIRTVSRQTRNFACLILLQCADTNGVTFCSFKIYIDRYLHVSTYSILFDPSPTALSRDWAPPPPPTPLPKRSPIVRLSHSGGQCEAMYRVFAILSRYISLHLVKKKIIIKKKKKTGERFLRQFCGNLGILKSSFFSRVYSTRKDSDI